MQKADPLIRTKLRLPYTRPELVPRPRLQEQIARGICGPLTLITAPAGFGKTTLVASCTANCGMSVAWLALDKHDNQIARFMGYFIAALQQADSTIGGEAAQLLDASQQAQPEIILTSLINELDLSRKDLVLVLDDYQFINSQAVHEQMAFLLEHIPGTLHVVIASRSDPQLPLARLRARGQTVELRAADLRFTESEAVQFLNDLMGLQLDERAVALLADRTEGWIAGLQMAALSMQGRDDVDGFIREFTGTNRFIMDFLLEEVLAREPQEVQDFLLQTAVLTRLNGLLCDAVTGASGGQQMLQTLERRNLFVVPLDDDRRWYRYHHLFSDLLQAQLYQTGPDKAARLQLRAAEWCEQNGQVNEAVGYALASREYGQAAGLIAKYWHLAVSNGEIETVWSWLNALPQDTIRNNAQLGVDYCWVLWLNGQISAIKPHLEDAEHAFSELTAAEGFNPHDAPFADLPAHLAILRSIVARYDNDYEIAVGLARQAIQLIPANSPPLANGQLRSLISLALASAYDGAGDLEQAASAYAETIHWSRFIASTTGVAITILLTGVLRLLGRLRAADAACRDALEYIQTHAMARLPAAGVLHVAMSEVLVEQNDLEAAQAHLSQGMELGKWSGRLDAVKNAAYVLSRLCQTRQDTDGALAAIQEAESALAEPAPLARAGFLALKARILVRQGSLRDAAQCIQEAVHLVGDDRGQTRKMVDLAAARVLAAQCPPDEAAAQLAQSLVTAEENGHWGAVIELLILRSLVLAQQGAQQEAEQNLERALTLAEPEGYVRIFLDEGQPMQALITRWLAHANSRPLREYAVQLLSQFNAETQLFSVTQEKVTLNSSLIEPLSQRELEVLQIMALGKTNQQIARQLFVAPGTIKAHTASIYRKLDAANRTEAVARARQLGILL